MKKAQLTGVKLLKDIRKRWDDVPEESVRMESYFTFPDDQNVPDYPHRADSLAELEEQRDKNSHCGTCACLGGWIQFFYAETEKEKAISASKFAKAVFERAGVPNAVAERLMEVGSTYGKTNELPFVTHGDVAQMLDFVVDYIKENGNMVTVQSTPD